MLIVCDENKIAAIFTLNQLKVVKILLKFNNFCVHQLIAAISDDHQSVTIVTSILELTTTETIVFVARFKIDKKQIVIRIKRIESKCININP